MNYDDDNNNYVMVVCVGGGGGCERDKSTALLLLFQSRVQLPAKVLLAGWQDSAIGQLISR